MKFLGVGLVGVFGVVLTMFIVGSILLVMGVTFFLVYRLLKPRSLGGLFATAWLVGCGQVVASSSDTRSAPDGSRPALDDGATRDGATRDGTTRDGTTRDVGTADDAGATRDVAACGTPFDATMALPDGGVCSGSCDHAGFGTGCCPGSVCVPCAIPTGDGSYIFNVEAGPFYCNVTMR